MVNQKYLDKAEVLIEALPMRCSNYNITGYRLKEYGADRFGTVFLMGKASVSIFPKTNGRVR